MRALLLLLLVAVAVFGIVVVRAHNAHSDDVPAIDSHAPFVNADVAQAQQSAAAAAAVVARARALVTGARTGDAGADAGADDTPSAGGVRAAGAWRDANFRYGSCASLEEQRGAGSQAERVSARYTCCVADERAALDERGQCVEKTSQCGGMLAVPVSTERARERGISALVLPAPSVVSDASSLRKGLGRHSMDAKEYRRRYTRAVSTFTPCGADAGTHRVCCLPFSVLTSIHKLQRKTVSTASQRIGTDHNAAERCVARASDRWPWLRKPGNFMRRLISSEFYKANERTIGVLRKALYWLQRLVPGGHHAEFRSGIATGAAVRANMAAYQCMWRGTSFAIGKFPLRPSREYVWACVAGVLAVAMENCVDDSSSPTTLMVAWDVRGVLETPWGTLSGVGVTRTDGMRHTTTAMWDGGDKSFFGVVHPQLWAYARLFTLYRMIPYLADLVQFRASVTMSVELAHKADVNVYPLRLTNGKLIVRGTGGVGLTVPQLAGGRRVMIFWLNLGGLHGYIEAGKQFSGTTERWGHSSGHFKVLVAGHFAPFERNIEGELVTTSLVSAMVDRLPKTGVEVSAFVSGFHSRSTHFGFEAGLRTQVTIVGMRATASLKFKVDTAKIKASAIYTLDGPSFTGITERVNALLRKLADKARSIGAYAKREAKLTHALIKRAREHHGEIESKFASRCSSTCRSQSSATRWASLRCANAERPCASRHAAGSFARARCEFWARRACWLHDVRRAGCNAACSLLSAALRAYNAMRLVWKSLKVKVLDVLKRLATLRALQLPLLKSITITGTGVYDLAGDAGFVFSLVMRAVFAEDVAHDEASDTLRQIDDNASTSSSSPSSRSKQRGIVKDLVEIDRPLKSVHAKQANVAKAVAQAAIKAQCDLNANGVCFTRLSSDRQSLSSLVGEMRELQVDAVKAGAVKKSDKKKLERRFR